MVIRRGEVWWASLPKPRGSEPGYDRPILVVSSDQFNASRINTVVGVVISTNIRLAAAPGNVVLSRRASGLPKKSVANVSQVVTIDKSFLTRRVKKLANDEFGLVVDGLKLVLSLS
jgi:mRNA interferase MazF